MSRVPDVPYLFGGFHAAGDRVRETAESEIPIPLGSAVGDEQASDHPHLQSLNANDVLDLTVGDRSTEADNIEVPNLPEAHQFIKWKAIVREAVASASRNPQAAFLWVRDVETATDISTLSESAGFPP